MKNQFQTGGNDEVRNPFTTSWRYTSFACRNNTHGLSWHLTFSVRITNVLLESSDETVRKMKDELTVGDPTKYRRKGILTMKNRKNIRAQIFIHKSRNGEICVPYTLIGYGIGNRVIVDDAGEHLYCAQEFEDVDVAVDEAKRRASETIDKKFPHIEERQIIWDVVLEGNSALSLV